MAIPPTGTQLPAFSSDHPNDPDNAMIPSAENTLPVCASKRSARPGVRSLFAATMSVAVMIFSSCGPAIDNPIRPATSNPTEDLSIYTGDITNPAPGAVLAQLTAIEGTRFGILDNYRLQLTRDSDGKSWTGTEWGGSGTTYLPLTASTSTTWTTSAAMPTGTSQETGLPNGFYLIKLFGRPSNPSVVYSVVFQVGPAVAPVSSTAWTWGYGGNGAVGIGPTPDANAPKKILTTGALAGKSIIAVTSGSEFSMALTSDGKIAAWGYNERGQLGVLQGDVGPAGDAGSRDVPSPVAIPSNLRVTSIAAGTSHALATTSTGEVLSWGDNAAGQTGAPIVPTVYDNRTLPHVILPGALAGKRVTQVGGGFDFSVALTSQGTLYAWGANNNGQLGDGTFVNRSQPVAVTGLTGKVITNISCGHNHTLALTSTGELYAFGLGTNGLLGRGSEISSNVPIKVAPSGAMAGKRVVNASASRYHSLALTSEGKVYAWGTNESYGLGDGGAVPISTLPILVEGGLLNKRVTHLSAGWWSSFAVTSEAEMYAWGYNVSGNLCGAVPQGGPSPSPLRAAADDAVNPHTVVAGIGAGWDIAVLLTANGGAPLPALVVEARGAELRKEAGLFVGENAIGASTSVDLFLRNRGTADLDNLAVTMEGAAFSVTAPGVTKLSPGQSAKITVTFTAPAGGTSSAMLRIASNDATTGLFTINLSGAGRSAGSADAGFADPGIVGAVNAMLVQPDGKIVVGGNFGTVGGVTRNHLARVNANGTVDTTFTANVVGTGVNCLALQPDGKIVVAGSFTQVSGQTRNRLARLNVDGSLDTAYNPNVADGVVNALHVNTDGTLFVGGSFSKIGAVSPSFLVKLDANGGVISGFDAVLGGMVRCLAVQEDGFILIGGNFQTVRGQTRVRLARLETDGYPDPDFIASVTGGNVYTLLLQGDGNILIGGDFTQVNGTNRFSIDKLDSSGGHYAGFGAAFSGQVLSMARSMNGKVVVTGSLSFADGEPVGNMLRINPDGGTDNKFNSGTNGVVNAVAIQTDGRIFIGGNFQAAGQSARQSMARLVSDNAVQNVDVNSFPGVVNWTFGGAFPDNGLSTLEVSTNGGATWTSFGRGVKLTTPAVGWTWFNSNIPSVGIMRLRAVAHGGLNNGTAMLIENLQTFNSPPRLQVALDGTPIQVGTTNDFGPVTVGGAKNRTVTLTNIGGTTLTGLLGTALENSNDFELLPPAADTLAPGASMTMIVAFKPRSTGNQSGSLYFTTNDPTPTLTAYSLSGTGAVALSTWRAQNFGTALNQGIAADSADPDQDGRSNLLEYATGSPPNAFDRDVAFFQAENGVIYFFYRRSKQAMGDIAYQVEYTNALGQPWISTDVGDGVVLEDGVDYQMVQCIVPVSASEHRFARLRVTVINPS